MVVAERPHDIRRVRVIPPPGNAPSVGLADGVGDTWWCDRTKNARCERRQLLRFLGKVLRRHNLKYDRAERDLLVCA